MSALPVRERAALIQTLETGAPQLGVQLPARAGPRLIDYLELLREWNCAFNLTAITDPTRMLTHHLLDSLSIAPYLSGQRILDVGTGAGLPGIPLALCFPGLEFHLLDGNGKKTRFLTQARTSLGLDNVTVHHARAELFRDPHGFATVMARAVTSLSGLIASAGHLLAGGGELLAMKGERPDTELAAVAAPYTVAACVALAVPGIATQRCLVRIRRDPASTTGRVPV